MKTDSQLQKDVIEELGWEPSINAAEIGVSVKDGIVTLSGGVASYAEKWDAELATQSVSGVKGTAVEINVKLPGSAKRSDTDIARAVGNVLQWATFLPQDTIKVLVENGYVTLSGEVQWSYGCILGRHLGLAVRAGSFSSTWVGAGCNGRTICGRAGQCA